MRRGEHAEENEEEIYEDVNEEPLNKEVLSKIIDLEQENRNLKSSQQQLANDNNFLRESVNNLNNTHNINQTTAEKYWREKAYKFEHELAVNREEENRSKFELQTLKGLINAKDSSIRDLDKKYTDLLGIYNEVQKSNEYARRNTEKDNSNLLIQKFLLGMEIERIRLLYLERENECISLEKELEKLDTELKGKNTLPIIQEIKEVEEIEHPQNESLLIKSFLLALENMRLRYIYNEATQEKEEMAELMEEMHSLVNEPSVQIDPSLVGVKSRESLDFDPILKTYQQVTTTFEREPV